MLTRTDVDILKLGEAGRNALAEIERLSSCAEKRSYDAMQEQERKQRARAEKAETRAQALTEAVHTLTELAAVNGAVNSGDIADLLADPDASAGRFYSEEEVRRWVIGLGVTPTTFDREIAALRAARGAR